MTVYGYARVSTVRQASEGESLDVQQRVMSGYAMMGGMTVDHMFVERGVSGTKALSDRPEGAALLAALKPGDVVITAKLDRMFRSALDAMSVLAKLKESGVSLHMIDLGGDVTGNGISKLVFTILSAVAEAERDRIAERVATVKADQRQRGRFLGGIIPFGQRVAGEDDPEAPEGDLVPVPEQQAAIVKMKAMRAEGASLRAIAAEMRANGHNLSHEGVRGLLERASA